MQVQDVALDLADAAGVKGGMCSAGCALGLCVPSNSLGTCELCGWGHISGQGFAVTTIIQVCALPPLGLGQLGPIAHLCWRHPGFFWT